jgi:hypothetical protein
MLFYFGRFCLGNYGVPLCVLLLLLSNIGFYLLSRGDGGGKRGCRAQAGKAKKYGWFHWYRGISGIHSRVSHFL